MPEAEVPAPPSPVQVGPGAKGVVANNFGNVTMIIGGEERTIPFLVPPRPPYSLVGREQLIARIKERLFAGENRDAAGLTVLPGAGKSALAVYLARDQEVIEHFPEGTLWAGLGRHPDLLALLGRWAVALGMPADELDGLTTVLERQHAIQMRIGERKMLLVVDDAWESEAARTFVLDCKNCAHLVTTRVRAVARDFAVDEGIAELDELSDEECVALLRQIAPHALEADEGAVRALVREVGGLPLAIVLIGRRLENEAASRDPDRIRDAIAALRSRIKRLSLELPMSAHERSPDLPASATPTLLEVIRISDEALDADAKHALFALSIFRPKPGSFTKDAAKAVADVEAKSVYALDDFGLVESVGPGEYAMQRTIADYARAQLSDDESAKLHRKAAAYYAQQLCAFDEDAGGKTSYERQCRLEDPAWQDAKVDWEYHRMLMADPDAARLDLTRTYLDAFWWWGCYTDYPFCRRLLEGTGLAGAEEDEEWLGLLRRFHEAYPTWREHRGKGDWVAVEGALLEICEVLGLDDDPARLDGERRHVRAMVDLFLAHAHRYRDHEDREADRLYDEAYRLLKGSDADDWSLGWIRYEQADLDAERGERDGALRKVADALSRAAAQRDYELLSNAHALRADLLWEQRDLAASVRERSVSLFNAYRFQRFPEAPDFYTLAYWDDAREGTLEWLADVAAQRGPAEAMSATIALHDAWAPELWTAWSGPGGHAPTDLVKLLAEERSDPMRTALFPAPPETLDEGRLAQIAAVLAGMADRFEA